MQKVAVNLGERSYEIRVGAGVLSRAGAWLKNAGFSGRAMVVTDDTVKKIYADVLRRSLEQARFNVTVLSVPAGEENKSLETAGRLYEELAGVRAERTTPVLALGGGVIGDLAGFVAATYLRGVPLVQVPTTLLAQVDSSIGGKTAVDRGGLKNMIGVFYQPKLVIADIDTLKTLPAVELSNGLAEVIKSAAIRDRDLFIFLEKNIDKAIKLQPEVLQNIVLRTAGIKAEIVAADEREAGPREVLNFGHTFGHAVESVSGFGLKHGQAVAVGMMAAARISRRLGILDASEATRLEKLIEAAGLPTRMPDLDRSKVLQAMMHDKKVRSDRVRFVLLNGIGKAFISDDIDAAIIEEVGFDGE
jgi:3-dehydroquinate synthase